MRVLGIKKSSGIELVDTSNELESLFPTSCPGGLGIQCDICSFAQNAGTVGAQEGPAGPPDSLILCHWYESRSVGGETTRA